MINARSLSRKFEDLGNQLRDRNSPLAIVSETWLDDTEKSARLIDHFEQKFQATWFGRNRADGGGGGVGIAVSNFFASATPLQIDTGGLEALWLLVKPAADNNFSLVVCSFYSPPSTSQYCHTLHDMEDHIAETVTSLKLKIHGRVGFIIAGDANHYPTDIVTDIEDFVQVVDKPTREDAILDLFLTDMPTPAPCQIFPPLAPNVLGPDGKPSDHNIVLVGVSIPPSKRQRIKIKRRLYSEKRAESFEEAFSSIDWDVLDGVAVDDMVGTYTEHLSRLVDKFFPIKTSVARVGDPLYFSDELRRLHRKVQRLYKNGNTQRYRDLRRQFRIKLLAAKSSFYNESQVPCAKQLNADLLSKVRIIETYPSS